MILEDKKIDSLILAMYGCTEEDDRILINCYDNLDRAKGLKFSKAIDLLSNKQTIGHVYNFLTTERLAPYPLGQEMCQIDSDTLYIFSNEWDMFTVQQVNPAVYNTIALINRLDDYTALANAFAFIHGFKTVVLVSTAKGQKWLYEANKRIQTDDTRVKTVHMQYLGQFDSINEYFVANGEEKTREMLAGMLNEPTDITVPGVVDIGTVQEEDRSRVRNYYTMLDKVDSKTGGLSGFWLMTGQTGNGKSEFCMQLSLAVIEQGGKVFYYSGEERKERFLNKLACKVADEKNIIKTPRKLWGGRYSDDDFDYYADPVCMNEFKAWLKDKYFICDEPLKGGNIADELIKMLEVMHKEKGVTTFFLDNLMTLTTGVRQSELNQVQTDLTNKLKDFQSEYNVIVVLVAHPKKTADAELKNTDISGSLNVANLAHVVMSVRRATKDEKDKDIAKGIDPRNSYITCTKNRPTGDLFKTGAYFDTVNKVFVQGKRAVFSWRKQDLDKYINNNTQEEFEFEF